jgi:hypothetical protein
MPAAPLDRARVGGLRPSQLMYSYGVGALVDLPNLSVVVGGLNAWTDSVNQREIVEERLLDAVRLQLGAQVQELKSAPWQEETRNALDSWAKVGIPVTPFPRWLRCSNAKCRMLLSIESGLWKLKHNPYKPELTHYEHDGCGGYGLSARFVLACPAGHLDDFPWIEFVHGGARCTRPVLAFEDVGMGIGGADAYVHCRTCNAKRHMALAFGERAATVLPRCRGRHPHLRQFEASCGNTATAMILGASNQWFPITRSVLSIPQSKDPVHQVVAELWNTLTECEDKRDLEKQIRMAEKLNIKELLRLKEYTIDEVWTAIEVRRTGSGKVLASDEKDLLSPEWVVLAAPKAAPESDEFRVREVAPPTRYATHIARVVLAERLREVTALTGFTRLESPSWDPGAPPPSNGAPLTTGKPVWVPAAESRGEGIFVQFAEDAVKAWEDKVESSKRLLALEAAHQRWRLRRHMAPMEGWRGARFVLLHTFAHLLINELALECGYSVASIRERIYCREDDGTGAPMAGVLIYTAAADSEGTLGGLVSLGEPGTLERLLNQAFERARLCASDPLCAEHTPDEAEDIIHNAACHACTFLPETSCQAGNRYLDRAVLVPTLAAAGVEFFDVSGTSAASAK